MAASNLLTLIDDIATLLDDVSLMTKVAAKKTAGVLGDDLALNAQQVTGVRADRELPVVWAVALGSLRNKAILVPGALLVSLVAPWLITPILMLGGGFLCYEGVEKVFHALFHKQEKAQDKQRLQQVLADPTLDVRDFEQKKIRGAIRTDFILSAEIIVITLGTVAESPFSVQLPVLIGIALVITAGVYGVVAAIVKLDDAGVWLAERQSTLWQGLGRSILAAAPWLMKTLSVVGTAAMFLVGGGILVHGIPALSELIHGVANGAQVLPGVGAILSGLAPSLLNALVGMLAGALLVGGANLLMRVRD